MNRQEKRVDSKLHISKLVSLLTELYGHLPAPERYAESMRFMSAVIGELQEDARGESWQLEDPYYYLLPIQAADHACVAAVKFFEHCAMKHRDSLRDA